MMVHQYFNMGRAESAEVSPDLGIFRLESCCIAGMPAGSRKLRCDNQYNSINWDTRVNHDIPYTPLILISDRSSNRNN